MKDLNNYEKDFKNRVDDNINDIVLNMSKDYNSVNEYLNNEFVELFEDLIMDGLLLTEGIGDWIKDKLQKGKNLVKGGVEKTKELINYIIDKFKKAFESLKGFLSKFSLAEMLKKIKKKFLKLEQKAIQSIAIAAESLREPLIELGFVDQENNFQIKEAYSKMMEWAKSDEEITGKIEKDQISGIDKALDSLPNNGVTESLYYITESFGKMEILNEEDTIKLYNPEDEEGSTKLTEETFEKGNFGGKWTTLLKKFLFKMGIKEAKANSLVSILVKIGIIGSLVKIVIAALVAFGVSMPAIGLPAFLASATFAPVLIILGGILLTLGVIMMIIWIIKPYPNLSDLKAYLKAWFDAYPDGRKNVKSKKQYVDVIKADDEGVRKIIPAVLYKKIPSGIDDLPPSLKNTKSRNLQLSVLLGQSGAPTPKYKEGKNGKAQSELTGDNYDAGPNARWIISTRKASPRKLLNRFIVAFPEMNLSFDNSIRIKSKQPGKELERNVDVNLLVYTDPKSGKEFTGKKIIGDRDLTKDRDRWEYVFNGVKNNGKNDVEFTDENIDKLNKEKQGIFSWLERMYIKYNVTYEMD